MIEAAISDCDTPEIPGLELADASAALTAKLPQTKGRTSPCQRPRPPSNALRNPRRPVRHDRRGHRTFGKQPTRAQPFTTPIPVTGGVSKPLRSTNCPDNPGRITTGPVEPGSHHADPGHSTTPTNPGYLRKANPHPIRPARHPRERLRLASPSSPLPNPRTTHLFQARNTGRSKRDDRPTRASLQITGLSSSKRSSISYRAYCTTA